jgi:hypothetical protein
VHDPIEPEMCIFTGPLLPATVRPGPNFPEPDTVQLTDPMPWGGPAGDAAPADSPTKAAPIRPSAKTAVIVERRRFLPNDSADYSRKLGVGILSLVRLNARPPVIVTYLPETSMSEEDVTNR